MAVLQLKNLTKKFGSFTAVDNISFDLKEGEILGLLGPNGAGKTTTIDMLLGLTKPTTGEIKIFNLPFEENREKILKQMNFSAAYVNLPWRLKVWENLYTFGRLYEVENYKEKIEILIKEFQLFDLRNNLTDSLSSGQLTRLYLCKAFVNNPRLLLLDEPTAFLDPDISDLELHFYNMKYRGINDSVMESGGERPIFYLFDDRNFGLISFMFSENSHYILDDDRILFQGGELSFKSALFIRLGNTLPYYYFRGPQGMFPTLYDDKILNIVLVEVSEKFSVDRFK